MERKKYYKVQATKGQKTHEFVVASVAKNPEQTITRQAMKNKVKVKLKPVSRVEAFKMARKGRKQGSDHIAIGSTASGYRTK